MNRLTLYSQLKNKMIIIISLYLVATALLYIYQRALLYFPTENTNHTYNTNNFSNDNETIEVLTFNTGMSKALIYFGGNGEAVAYNLLDSDFTQLFSEYTVYLLSYRGYGGSSGSPSEHGIFSDALMLYERVSVNHKTISLMGRSLGSGVAIYLASLKNVEKIALITPYDSIQSVAQNKFKIFPMPFLLKDKYDSISRVSNVKAKTLAVIAENDDVITNKHSTRLVNKFPTTQIKSITIKNTNHSTVSEADEYYNTLKQFFSD